MDGKNDPLAELPLNSLLVYPLSGLVRLYVPIPALCIRKVAPFEVGDLARISGISHNTADPLLYLINGRFYSHSYFKILTTKQRTHEHR